MALYRPKIEVKFKCGYKPCGFEGIEFYNADDSDRFLEVKICPKCYVCNYKAAPIELAEVWLGDKPKE